MTKINSATHTNSDVYPTEQYILKSAVVEELERLYNLEYVNTSNLSCGKKIMLRHILLFLDTLEVRDDSLDKFKTLQNITGDKSTKKMEKKYIDKAALIAEIEKRRSKNSKNKLNLAAAFEDNYLLSFVNTLKVKEVDSITHTIIAECCDWLAMNTNLSHDKIEECRNLMLTVKEE